VTKGVHVHAHLQVHAFLPVLGLVLGLASAMGCAAEDARPTVTVWHTYAGGERTAFEATARAIEARDPSRRIALVAVPYEAFADKVTSAIPNGNGPDLFVFAHDRVGDWVATGLLEPIEYYVDDALAGRYVDDALAALAYQGSLYGLPLAVKSLALYYRTDLVATPPTTTDELVALGRRLTTGGRFGLAYKSTDLYGHAPWLFGFGGRLFDERGAVDLDGRAALDAAEFARALGAIMPPDVDGAAVATLFGAGKAAMAISGPWLATELPAGVPWAVTSLPIVSPTGRPATPFLGVEAVLMSSRARDKDAAFAVMAALADDDAALLRARDGRQVVASKAAYDADDIGGDKVLGAFRRQASSAVVMPATPAMRMVWTPYETALQAIIAQGARPDDALGAAEREVAGYVAPPRRGARETATR
jgi:arabinogalactan oligomer/maltooligosaccharide transport system substrate-binding protein